MEARETRMEAREARIETHIKGIADALKMLSGDIHHNAIMAERGCRQEWNRSHPLDLLEEGRGVGVDHFISLEYPKQKRTNLFF
jgi:hypothetical protein